MKALLFPYILFFTISTATAAEPIKPGETLTLERAIHIALSNHPAIIAAKNDIEAERSRVGQARSAYFPRIELSANYTKYDPAIPTVIIPATVGRPPYDRYEAAATLSQNVFDFGRTSSGVTVQKYMLDSANYTLWSIRNDVIYNVKQAYFSVSQFARNRDVAERTVKKFELQLKRAEGFFRAGVRSRFDVTKAKVDLSNARLGLIRAENALKLAVINLNNAMGQPDAPEYEVEDILSYQKYQMTFEEALDRAYKQRPDLLSLSARKEAANASVSLAQKEYLPRLTASASYNWAGYDFPLERGWSATATLTFPLFSGFLTVHKVSEAKSNLLSLSAQEELLRQAILLEVKQGYHNLIEAEERIHVADLAIQQAEENLEIANRRYQAGVGNPIEVTDAEVAFATAQRDYIQALYDYKIARARLEKAMGGE